MRNTCFAMILPLLATACDPGAPTDTRSTAAGDGPTITNHQIDYWGLGNSVEAYITATPPAGPVTIGGSGAVLPIPLDTSAVDTLAFTVPLGDRSRAAGVTAAFDCVAQA